VAEAPMAASSGKAAASFAASSVSVGAKGIFIALFIVVGVHSRCSHFMHTHQHAQTKLKSMKGNTSHSKIATPQRFL
jgi:hypothetical protein